MTWLISLWDLSLKWQSWWRCIEESTSWQYWPINNSAASSCRSSRFGLVTGLSPLRGRGVKWAVLLSELCHKSLLPRETGDDLVRLWVSAERGLADLRPRHVGMLLLSWRCNCRLEDLQGFCSLESWTGVSLLHWALLIIHQETVHLKQQRWVAANTVQEAFCEDPKSPESEKKKKRKMS